MTRERWILTLTRTLCIRPKKLGAVTVARVRIRGKLHLDLVHQGRLIPNNVNVRLKLTRSRQEFFMMSFVRDQSPFKITIEFATLEARRVKLAPSEQLRLERVLSFSSGGLYPITHVVVKFFYFEQRCCHGRNRIHVCRPIAQQNIPVHGCQRGILWQI